MRSFGEFEIADPVEFGKLLILKALLCPIASTYQGEKLAVPSITFECQEKESGKPAPALNVCWRAGGITLAQVRKDGTGREYLHTLASHGYNKKLEQNVFKPGINDQGVRYNITLDVVGPIFEVAGNILDDDSSEEFRSWLMTPEALEMGSENRSVNSGLSKAMGVGSDHWANVRRAIAYGGGADAYRQAAADRASGMDSGVLASGENPFNF